MPLKKGSLLLSVSEASQEIFRIASMAPGALLLEAQKEYEVMRERMEHGVPQQCRAAWLGVVVGNTPAIKME